MDLIFKIGWRNIWRNWRRSLITMLAIFFAAMLTVVMRGVQLGTYEYNIETSIKQFSGYLQIQDSAFSDNPSLRNSFAFDDSLRQILDGSDLVKAYSPRIISQGLIGYEQNSYGTSIFGLHPVKEKQVTILHEKVVEGRFIKEGSPFEAIVGIELADNLGVSVGDTVVLLSSGFDGTMGNFKFEVVGLSRMGQSEFDAMSVMIPIEAADMLFSMYGRLTNIAISLDGLNEIEEAKSYLNSEITKADISVLDWMELMPDLKQNVELDNIFGIFFLVLLLAIVAAGILNTILMSVTERFREFGVMLALGTKHKTLISAVFIETLVIMLISLAGGLIAGYIINIIIVNNPIPIGGDIGAMSEEFGFKPEVHSAVKPVIFWMTALRISVITLLVFIMPMFKLRNLEALKGIRYT